jgi:selenide, water dikinase
MPLHPDPRVLVDYRTADDAGVYRWEAGPALVQTVDFFTPIVDDPFVYGQISAANSLSDVYAMGGRPLTALAIAAFPAAGLEEHVMRDVFRGGLDKLREAGVSLLGGHTVRDNEIKFGYAVTGAVDPDRILSNAGARPGDALFLTKPIGTGVVGTAIKFERAPAPAVNAAVTSMLMLNRAAAEALATVPGAVHGCTDITGFGLIGHASEMAAASGVTLVIEAAAVPLLPGVRDLVAGNRAGGMKTNEAYFPVSASGSVARDPDLLSLLYDPQTSGGLLVAVAAERADAVRDALLAQHVLAAEIGRVEAGFDRRLVLE